MGKEGCYCNNTEPCLTFADMPATFIFRGRTIVPADWIGSACCWYNTYLPPITYLYECAGPVRQSLNEAQYLITRYYLYSTTIYFTKLNTKCGYEVTPINQWIITIIDLYFGLSVVRQFFKPVPNCAQMAVGIDGVFSNAIPFTFDIEKSKQYPIQPVGLLTLTSLDCITCVPECVPLDCINSLTIESTDIGGPGTYSPQIVTLTDETDWSFTITY